MAFSFFSFAPLSQADKNPKRLSFTQCVRSCHSVSLHAENSECSNMRSNVFTYADDGSLSMMSVESMKTVREFGGASRMAMESNEGTRCVYEDNTITVNTPNKISVYTLENGKVAKGVMTEGDVVTEIVYEYDAAGYIAKTVTKVMGIIKTMTFVWESGRLVAYSSENSGSVTSFALKYSNNGKECSGYNAMIPDIIFSDALAVACPELFGAVQTAVPSGIDIAEDGYSKTVEIKSVFDDDGYIGYCEAVYGEEYFESYEYSWE